MNQLPSQHLPVKLGNVCPARLDADVLNYLPHEPAMYGAEHFLIPIDPRILSTVIVKICRYCGSLYGEMDGGA